MESFTQLFYCTVIEQWRDTCGEFKQIVNLKKLGSNSPASWDICGV